MQTIPYSKFRHGRKLKCKIKGVQIDDAKVSVDSRGRVYICSNEGNADEYHTNNKLGYRHSWLLYGIGEAPCDDHYSVTDIVFLDRTIEDVQEGDVVVDEDGYNRKVLGRCGDVVFLSSTIMHEAYSCVLSVGDLRKGNYKIKQDTPITEVTLQEVADKMGVPVEQLRIKE
jgi:hypothetical protein